MLAHALKEMVDEMRDCTCKDRTDKVDKLWLRAQNLMTEARNELDENIMPYLRKRNDGDDPAYLAAVKLKGLLRELNNNT